MSRVTHLLINGKAPCGVATMRAVGVGLVEYLALPPLERCTRCNRRLTRMSPRAAHLLAQLDGGNTRIFADDEKPPGFAFLAGMGLAVRVGTTDRAALTEAGQALIRERFVGGAS